MTARWSTFKAVIRCVGKPPFDLQIPWATSGHLRRQSRRDPFVIPWERLRRLRCFRWVRGVRQVRVDFR